MNLSYKNTQVPKDIFTKTYIAGWVMIPKLGNQQNAHSLMKSLKINREMMHSYDMLCWLKRVRLL